MIGDSAQLRDHAIECGALEALEHVMEKVEGLSDEFERTIAWTYSNICRHKKPSLSIALLHRMAPAIVKLLSHKASVFGFLFVCLFCFLWKRRNAPRLFCFSFEVIYVRPS